MQGIQADLYHYLQPGAEDRSPRDSAGGCVKPGSGHPDGAGKTYCAGAESLSDRSGKCLSGGKQ